MKYNKEKLRTLCMKGANIHEISAEFNCSPISVVRWLSKDNLKLRIRDEKALLSLVKKGISLGKKTKELSVEAGLTLNVLKEFMTRHGLYSPPTLSRQLKTQRAIELRSQNKSFKEIGVIMGLSHERVRQLLLGTDILKTIIRKESSWRKEIYLKHKWDLLEGISLGKTLKDLSREWGVTSNRVAWLSKQMGGAEMKRIADHLKTQAFLKLYNEGYSVREIARMFDFSVTNVYRILKKS